MRVFSIFATFVVAALVYALVFERDRIIALLPDTSGVDTATEATPAETADTGQQDDVMRVVAVRSRARTIESAVTLRGATEADRQVELRAETSGQVISDPLRKGAFVEEGQVLCRLEPDSRELTLAEARARLAEARSRVPEARAQVPESEARVDEARARVTEAEARLEEAEINANAARALVKEGFASQTRVANTKAAVRSAEAAIESARAQLRAAESGRERVAAAIEAAKAGVESAHTAVAAAQEEIDRLKITAPFAGLLESDSAEVGSLLQPGNLCATVIQLDPIILVGFVPETAVGRVEMGARATARLASGENVEGEVTFISRAADETTRTFRVEIEVPNPHLTLRDGETAEITIRADGTKAHRLPQSALTLNDEGILGVRVVTGAGEAAFRPVTVLRDTPDGAWLSGLPDRADVIIIGQEFVTDGVRVLASYEEPDT